MVKEEMIKILSALKVAYPTSFQNMQSNDARILIELWYETFKDYDIKVLKLAILNLIKKTKFVPTISEIIEEIEKLTSTAKEEPMAIDEWNLIRKAIKNSIYGAEEGFESLPPIAKKFVGQPQQLRDWGLMSDFNEGVIRGQFLKQYDVLKERQRYKEMLEKSDLKNILGVSPVKTIEGVTNE